MKKAFSYILVLCAVISLLSGCGGGDRVIKIGVFEPSTGDNSAGGKQESLGIQYANYKKGSVSIGGKRYRVELVALDNRSSPDSAPAVARSLISQEVSVVIGSYGSSVSLAAGNTFEEAGIPVIGCSCTNPGITQDNSCYFRICFTDLVQGAVMANYAVSRGAKKAYVLTQQGDAYSSELGEYFTSVFEASGGAVTSGSFTKGTSDFTTCLRDAFYSGADVLFTPIYTSAATSLLEQAASIGFYLPIMAGDTWDSPVILEASKNTGLDISVAAFFDEQDSKNDSTASSFVSGFKVWLNSDPKYKEDNGGGTVVASVSALGYDAYNLALKAIEDADSTDPAKIRQALAAVDFTGVTGKITFNPNGDANKDMVYIKSVDTQSGKFEFVKTQRVTNAG